MAGEIRGRMAEALTLEALEIMAAPPFRLKLWDSHHPSLLWKADLFGVVRRRKVLLLVTYSGSETHSKEKFWRNLAETIDAKLALGADIKAIAVNYKARMRPKLAAATQQLLDGYLEVTEGPFATFKQTLQRKCRGKTQDEIKSLVGHEMWRSASMAQRRTLVAALTKLLADTNVSPAGLWGALSVHRKHVATPPPRNRSIHAAIVKLSIAPDDVQSSILAGSSAVTVSKCNPLMRKIGLITGISNRVSSDVVALNDLLGDGVAGDVLRNGITRTGKAAVAILQNTALLSAQGAYVLAHSSELSEASGMTHALLRCFRDPAGELSGFVDAGTDSRKATGCWLYTYLKNAFALVYGRQGQEWIEQVSQATGYLRSILVGLQFPVFERGEKLLPVKTLNALAAVFAVKWKAKSDEITARQDAAINEIVATTISNRLSPHGFESLWHIVRLRLQAEGLQSDVKQVSSSVSEFCGLDRKTGSTKFLCVGNSLIHCKLLTRDGRDHKVKELFARSALTRVQYERSTGHWQDRKEVKHLYLVLDGEVQEEDLTILSHAWWDGVFYVDALDGLVRVLKRGVAGT